MTTEAKGTATATRQVDNERTIITEWRFRPGDNTGWHRHGYDYAVVPLSDGTLTIRTGDGETTAELKHGQTYFRKAGVEHDVINASDRDFAFVEIEFR
jgi:quercetin dioxygenase-like cupin family protein